jgi:hypothetical protein
MENKKVRLVVRKATQQTMPEEIVRKAIAWKYYGIKVNQEVLDIKKQTINTVVELLGIKDSYVIGRDEELSATQKPHYHIHFKDERTFEALQQHKKRYMPEWGRSTKLYHPKDRVENILCWFGYATKEKEIYVSPDIDKEKLKLEQHTQAEFKKSQINFGKQQEEKKAAKKDLETSIYDQLDDIPIEKEFRTVALHVIRIYREIAEHLPIKSQFERITWKYLTDRKFKTDEDYLLWNYSHDKL